ncbi:hypothetical protein G6F54_014365 [Rhizopus delemar]|nr:hypothetical protein G6F54_014365 [Rhizopus delemar]
MADKPAATLLHLGPGLGNGLANLHNAKRARTPMVNIVGRGAPDVALGQAHDDRRRGVLGRRRSHRRGAPCARQYRDPDSSGRRGLDGPV